MKLHSHRYGKAKVRVFKKLQQEGIHTPKELEVTTLLEGDFGASFTKDDNSQVIATDSIKNTINVLAHQLLGSETEPFAIAVTQHFLKKYSQVTSVTVETNERVWERMTFGGKPSPANFISSGKGVPWTRTIANAKATETTSGVRELVILKTSGSAWEGYWRDELTTLPETKDRLLATSLTSSWLYRATPASYAAANTQILEAMLEVFASRFSPSVQNTLYQMGEAALTVCSEIGRISLTMPNIHYLLIDLRPFDRKNDNELFVPTDAPQGWIEATVER
jgi:urate oxidase